MSKVQKSLTRLKLRCQQNFIYFRASKRGSKRECCCCSVTKSCPNLCDPMDCSILGFPVLHYLPEFAQTHVHWVSDAIQPSHPLPSSSAFAFNPSQHPGLSNKSALCIRLPKYWSFNFSISLSNKHSGLISFRIDWFDPLAVQELSRVFSSTTVQGYQFFCVHPSVRSNSHINTWLLEKS